MIIHNKLVRDRIPEIIEKSGKTAYCHILSNDEYIVELDCKLNEECAEYQEDKSIEELADMLEVIRASQSCRQSCNKSQCPACGCRSHHSCTHAPQFSRSFPAREWGSVLQRQGACGQCP